MRLKAIIPLILATTLLALALTPLSRAADPDLVPLGRSQSDARAAYRALFSHASANGRAHWAQQSFDHAGTTYPPGTLVAPDGLPGSGFDRFSVTGPVNARPALALDAGGTRVAIFRSTVTGNFGAVDWEVADVRETLDSWLWGTLAYDILDEADLAAADLGQYALLILPSVRWGNEQDVLDKLNPAARANLNAFVENGGFLYAQANGAVIAEAAGLVPSGTIDLANPLRLAPGAANNAGRMSILDPASPLAFSWLTDTLYLLTDPAYHAGPLNVVAEFTNLDGTNQPAILTGEVGRGRVILVDGHPTAATRRHQLPVLLDAILWALGRPAELFGDAVQAYNPALDAHLLPAYDPGAVVSASLTFANVWDSPMSGVIITETVADGFEVLPGTVSPAATLIAQTNPTRTLLVWDLGDVPPGEISLSFRAQTGPTALAKGEITFATGAASYTHFGRAHLVSHHPFNLTSRMAARLQLDRDLEDDRQYFIPAEGLYLDVTVPMENKDETLAANVVITDVVLLIAPIVGLDDQETIEDLNNGETIWVRNEPFFYDETTGAPYLWPDGYTRTVTNTLTLADWDGAVAEFDVPYGTHLCGLSDDLSIQGTGNCVTIPVSYTRYITITPDNKLLLPVKVLTWTLGGWPGYHYEEPALRYGIHSQELFSRPVTFAGDPGIVPDQLVMRDTGGSVYTHLGDAPIFYRNHVSSGAFVYTPAAPVQPLISWQDIWSRTYTVPLRSTFYDLFSWASCGSCGPGTGETHAYLNVTFGMQADLDGDGQRDEEVLIYPSQTDTVNLDIVIKDKALTRAIPGNEMVVDLGMFKGLGIQIGPRNGTWANSYTANPANVTLVEVQHNSPAYDNLIFQHDVPTGAPAQITLHAVINRTSDVLAEGMLKLHDGARFTYRQQYAGPSRYEVYDTHVQGVIGEGPNIKLTKQGTPSEVSTYGDTVYYVFTLTDTVSASDPRWYGRNDERLDPFLQSYGFGDAAATTYVGGREQKELLHSIVKIGDLTRLRVELNNNTGVDWSSVTVTPQPPANITVTKIFTAAPVPPPIFPDIPFLHQSFIPDAGRSVFYFDVQIAAAYSGPRGQFIEIPVAVSGSGLPADFSIPPAKVGIEDETGQVFHVFGPAQTLVLTDSLPGYVTLTDAAIATKAQRDALTGAVDNNTRVVAFNTLTESIGKPPVIDGIAAFNLPGDALSRLYVPDAEPLYIVARGVISPPSAGPNWANYGAQASFTDQFGLTGRVSGDPFLVEAHGAAVRVNYACRGVITGVIPSAVGVAETADMSACMLYTDESHQVKLAVTVYNDGDYRAEAITATLNLPAGVTVLTTTPAARDVTTGTVTVTWEMGDLAPGGWKTVDLDVFVELDEAGVINAAGIQPYAEVIQRTDGQFFDQYSDRTIQDQLAADFNLVVTRSVRTYLAYLPVIVKEFNQQPDLIIKSLQAGNDGVTVVVQNIGNAPATESFWVDVYLNPSQPPAYNQHWWQLAGEGLVWGVTQAIPPGGEIRLSVGDAFYSTEYSRFSGAIADGTPVWAQVDSVNLNSSYGGVWESNESNNVTGPVTPTTAALETGDAGAAVAPQKALPPR